MNPSLLERQAKLPKRQLLAAMLSVVIGSIPTFALAQTSQYTGSGPAPAPSPSTRLNGSVTQSTSNGSSNGMRMTRGQTVGQPSQNQHEQSLFSGDAMSSFQSNAGGASSGTAQNNNQYQQPLVAPQAFQNQVSQSQSNPPNQPDAGNQSNGGLRGGLDIDKAISIGTTMFGGLNRFNQLMNENHQPISALNGSAMSNSLLNRSNMSVPGTSLLNGAAGQLFKVAKPLNRNEINLLSTYDVDVIIDKSGSMQTRDCPGGFSRWDFCREQLLNLTSQITTAFHNGITVALFSSGYQIFQHVDFSAVPQIFATNSPDGGTYLARPLRELLDNYFAGRDRNMSMRAPTRPLLIEIITDGEPSDKDALIEVICEATQKMTSPREVSIQFLQIGHEMEGGRVLNQLDNRLVSDDGAQYDIVNVEPFDSILNEGLARSLVNAASTH